MDDGGHDHQGWPNAASLSALIVPSWTNLAGSTGPVLGVKIPYRVGYPKVLGDTLMTARGVL